MDELFDIYNESGVRIGVAPRRECHGNPALLHRTAHVVIFHPEGGALLLQKRSYGKDIQPGKWDTAVGGHLNLGEEYPEGAVRELREELGVTVSASSLQHLFDSRIRNEIESEDVRIFGLVCAGPFTFQASEIDEIRFWKRAELFDSENQKEFTPNLIAELNQLRQGGWL